MNGRVEGEDTPWERLAAVVKSFVARTGELERWKIDYADLAEELRPYWVLEDVNSKLALLETQRTSHHAVGAHVEKELRRREFEARAEIANRTTQRRKKPT